MMTSHIYMQCLLSLSSHSSLPLRVSSRFTLDSLLTHRTGTGMLHSETYRCPDCYAGNGKNTRGWTSPEQSLQSPALFLIIQEA